MKVAINNCFGGFGLTDEAFEWLIKKGVSVTKLNKKGFAIDKKAEIVDYEEVIGDGHYSFNERDSKKTRTSALLIECVETLGKKVNGACAELKIVEIPNDISWQIDEYDGLESIHEQHREWS